MAVPVGLQTTPLNYSQAFIADYTVGITIALLETVLSLTVLTIALSCATPIPVLYRTLGALDCRLSTIDSLEAGCRLQTDLFVLTSLANY
jgi:hypothetical protein